MFRLLKMKELSAPISPPKERLLQWEQITNNNDNPDNSPVTITDHEIKQSGSQVCAAATHSQSPQQQPLHDLLASSHFAAIKIQAAFRGYLVSTSFDFLIDKYKTASFSRQGKHCERSREW